MRRYESEAIVLEVSDLHEGDRIVTFLTREQGRKRGVARGARRRYSRFVGQLQPLARVRVDWFEKQDRDLVRIGDVELLRPAAALTSSLERVLVGAYLAEQTALFAQENEPSERTFRLLDATTEAILAGVDPLLCARYFEMWTLRLAGLLGDASVCPLCERELRDRAVLPDEGEALVCDECAGGASGRRIGAPTLRLIGAFGRTAPRALAEAPPAGSALRELQVLCAEIRRRFLGHELRSYGVMERTLAEVGSDLAAKDAAEGAG
ncbi:MAG TPA: DNA repair protein RecO [Thermoanaerobaculia bacterium]|nr:DNA repair protein RecO [Thermoanaerobaculia bacterium]